MITPTETANTTRLIAGLGLMGLTCEVIGKYNSLKTVEKSSQIFQNIIGAIYLTSFYYAFFNTKNIPEKTIHAVMVLTPIIARVIQQNASNPTFKNGAARIEKSMDIIAKSLNLLAGTILVGESLGVQNACVYFGLMSTLAIATSLKQNRVTSRTIIDLT